MGPKKDGLIAKYSVNHQLKTSARLPKSTDCELLNTDIDTTKKSTLRSCTTNPQENNTLDSKGICTKFLEENATCGSNRRYVHLFLGPLSFCFSFLYSSVSTRLCLPTVDVLLYPWCIAFAPMFVLLISPVSFLCLFLLFTLALGLSFTNFPSLSSCNSFIYH
jgi:hypothetical protein